MKPSSKNSANNSTTKSSTATRRQAIISEPIGSTLFKLTVPMFFALIAIMGLGLVDSYFISFLGTQELAAMGFVVPIATTMTSAALGLGMAISSLTSKLIGAEKLSSAARMITDGLYLTVAVSTVLSGLLAWQLEPVFKLIGADTATMKPIMAYMNTWLLGCVFLMLTMVCSSAFRAIGDTKTSAIISVVLTLVNLCLDPLLIFGIGPFPKMGIQGAALASVLATCISVAISIYYLGIKEKLILATLPKWSVFKTNLTELVSIAIPAVLANAIVPLTITALTILVAEYGAQAVAGFGVGGRIESVSLIFVYALSATLPLFIGQNLGAGKKSRVADAIRITFKFVFFLQLGMYFILVVFAQPIAAIFSEELGVQKIITNYLWIIPISYGFSSMVLLTNVAMNVLGKPQVALYINLIRLALIYFPLAYIGSYIYDLKGIFIGISFGNLIAFLMSFVFLKMTFAELEIPFNKGKNTVK